LASGVDTGPEAITEGEGELIDSCRFDHGGGARENAGSVISDTFWRDELVRRLRVMDRPLRETCFVLLWSYFEDGEWLTDAENLLARQGIFPTDLEGIAPPPELSHLDPWIAEATRHLATLEKVHFDLFALKWLRTLNDLLGRNERPHLNAITGLSGRQFRVHRRSSLVASKLTGRHPSTIAVEKQSNALEAYARDHKTVPVEAIRGHGVRIENLAGWGGPHLHNRLGEQLGAQKGHFRVLIWPLSLQLKYSGLTEADLLELERRSSGKVSYVHLSEVDNEDLLITDIQEALATAREKEATLLLLPELAIPSRTEKVITATLASHGIKGFPILTLFGCSHRKIAGCESSVNEAILLGPGGNEVFRYRKLTRYSGEVKTKTPEEDVEIIPLAEQIETGKVLTVLECAFGNLAPVICLDLFGKAGLLEISHANLLAVPSLSPKVSPHLSAAKTLMARNRACTFVANHWLKECGAGGRSFYITPVLPDETEKEMGYTTHWNVDEGKAPASPYLLFDLPAAEPGKADEPEAALDNQTKVK
jgi:predicted amidohydrolase